MRSVVGLALAAVAIGTPAFADATSHDQNAVPSITADEQSWMSKLPSLAREHYMGARDLIYQFGKVPESQQRAWADALSPVDSKRFFALYADSTFSAVSSPCDDAQICNKLPGNNPGETVEVDDGAGHDVLVSDGTVFDAGEAAPSGIASASGCRSKDRHVSNVASYYFFHITEWWFNRHAEWCWSTPKVTSEFTYVYADHLAPLARYSGVRVNNEMYLPKNVNYTTFTQAEFGVLSPFGNLDVHYPTINMVLGNNGSYIFHGKKN